MNRLRWITHHKIMLCYAMTYLYTPLYYIHYRTLTYWIKIKMDIAWNEKIHCILFKSHYLNDIFNIIIIFLAFTWYGSVWKIYIHCSFAKFHLLSSAQMDTNWNLSWHLVTIATSNYSWCSHSIKVYTQRRQ